jgi:hypothetical protein
MRSGGATGAAPPVCILSEAEPVTVCVCLDLWAIFSDLLGRPPGRLTAPGEEPFFPDGPAGNRLSR